VALKGTYNSLLPELDLFATVQNNGLAGQMNSMQANPMPDPSMTGGYGTFLDQLATHRYPSYEVGVQLNLPLRNRVAQADATRDELSLRAQQTRLLAMQNQAEMEAEDAVIAIRRSRASYQAAVRTRVLQEQSVDVEKARFEAGVSTAATVILYESYLAQARSTEVVSRGNYFKAKAALDRALGSSLAVNHIELKDAYGGVITSPPSHAP
jgi:outer membrane protein